MKTRLCIYDTTLRDGQQTQDVQFSTDEKQQIARALDALGVDYIEGGWPGANPTDNAFFEAAPKTRAKLTAFGMTKRLGISAQNDDVLAAVMNAGTDSVCLVGKTHEFHVKRALGITLDENLTLLRDSVGHLTASGREAPLKHSVGSGGTKQEYRVFTRSGETVNGAAYLGTAGGLAQAFKSAGGTSSWNHETRLMQALNVDAVQLDVMVDFASVESSGNAEAMQIANTNRASVSGDARLSISGQMRIVPRAELKCWERFGKNECGPMHDMAKVTSRLGLSHDEPFYDSLVDSTTTGDKVAAGFTKALSTLAMLGGVGGSSSTEVTRYTITVNPDTYGRVAGAATTSFVDMAVLAAKREGSK